MRKGASCKSNQRLPDALFFVQKIGMDWIFFQNLHPKSELQMTITEVRLSDLATLRDLAERTFRDAWQDMNEPEAFENYCREKFTVAQLRLELETAGAEFYFAMDDGLPVAYLKLNFDKNPGSASEPDSHEPWEGTAVQIERIYVLPDYQGRRIGGQLLRFAEDRAHRTGSAWIWLSVWQKSPRSIQFYERNGYTIFGVETFWVGNDPQPDWLMRKKITD